MIDFETISFKIITFAGEAKKYAMQALTAAKEGQFDALGAQLELAEQNMVTAEQTHMEVIVAEAKGEKLNIPVLFMHAEDQLLTTQTLILLVKELIAIYQVIKK